MSDASALPFDGVLLLSFGAPEQSEDVLPFLRRVTHGRGIPPDRLLVVGEHYHLFDGRSPLNDQNRALIAALRAELDGRGLYGLPVYWGNRNWHPFMVEALAQAVRDGRRHLAVVITSAYPSYSGCRQYREDLAAALDDPAVAGASLRLDKIRHYGNHPGFVEPVVDGVVAGLAELPEEVRGGARIVFVTHSVPTGMNGASGPRGNAYLAAHRDVAAAVADLVAARLGRPVGEWDLVYCSRSGPPAHPWLEPDVNDHLRELRARGVDGVVVVPIGFVSDHMEVVYDLDIEARRTAQEIGLAFVRCPTVGTDPRFVAALVDLVLERAEVLSGGSPARPALGTLGPWHDVCPQGCCRNQRGWRPVVAGTPEEPPAAGAEPPVPAARAGRAVPGHAR